MIYGILFMFGVLLICLNMMGLFISMRNPEIHEEKTGFEDDINISQGEFYKILSDIEYSDEVYVVKVTEAVNQALAHYWDQQGEVKYNMRIPVQENFLLYFFSQLLNRRDKRYEFCDYKKAVERGVGLCSQHAIILDSVLDDNEIESNIISFSEHVLVIAKVNQEGWWMLDPDYGVVIPHDIKEISGNPDLISQYYYEVGYDLETIQRLKEIFTTAYRSSESVDEYFRGYRCRAERISYILIWFFPLLFIFTGSLPFIRGRRGDRE